MDFQEMASQPRCTLRTSRGRRRARSRNQRRVRSGSSTSATSSPAGALSPRGRFPETPPCPRAGSSLTHPREFCCPARRSSSGRRCASRAGHGWTRVVSGILGGEEEDAEKSSALTTPRRRTVLPAAARAGCASTTAAATTAHHRVLLREHRRGSRAHAAARAVNRGCSSPSRAAASYVSEEERRNNGGSSHGGQLTGLSSHGGCRGGDPRRTWRRSPPRSDPPPPSAWNRDAEPVVGLDGILVLHLKTAGTFSHRHRLVRAVDVWKAPPRASQGAVSPPTSPSRSARWSTSSRPRRLRPRLLRPPARATLENLARVRLALDSSHVSGAAADLSGSNPTCGFALLAFFAATPTPLLATPRRCVHRVDDLMARWSAAAADAASAARNAGRAWTPRRRRSRVCCRRVRRRRSCSIDRGPGGVGDVAHAVAPLCLLFDAVPEVLEVLEVPEFLRCRVGRRAVARAVRGGRTPARRRRGRWEAHGKDGVLGAFAIASQIFWTGSIPPPPYDVQREGESSRRGTEAAGSGADGFTPAPGPAASGSSRGGGERLARARVTS